MWNIIGFLFGEIMGNYIITHRTRKSQKSYNKLLERSQKNDPQ